MKKLQIEYYTLDKLKPYINNAKLHPADQIEQIKKSIMEFGFDDPIAVWGDDTIIEGHGRLIAAHELQLNSVPVIRLDHLTDEQRKAYALVHNKLTMNSGFDFDILEEELESIGDINMEDFGFNLEDFSYIDDLMENEFKNIAGTADEFSVTYVFPKEFEPKLMQFQKDNGKEKVVQMIIEGVENA